MVSNIVGILGGGTLAPQPPQQPANTPDVVSNIVGALVGGTPGGNGGIPTQAAGSGTQDGSKADQGKDLLGSQQDNGASPTPLVLDVGGQKTTIAPTVIAGPQGPITGFVVAPGSTLLPGGSPIVISGTTLSLPIGSESVVGTETSISTTSTTLGIGDVIASGIGFTSAPAVSTGGSSHHGSDMLLWCYGFMAGAVGGLAVWL